MDKKLKYLKEAWSKFQEEELPETFYHGSMVELPVGTVLAARDNYEENWSSTDFYHILEKYRPENMLSHKESVFMVGNDEDVDLAGGGTEFLFTVKPLGPIQKHDVNWSSEISMLVSDGYDIDSEGIKKAAMNYWNGVPHYNEQVWEYLTTKAEILTAEEY